MKQPVVLKVYRGDKLESVRQFDDKQIVIGREGVQLELKGNSVSALHAMIEDREGTYYLSDLGSQAGTFKNQEPILEERLSSGDVITIGDYRIQFFIGAPTAAVPPPMTKPPDTIDEDFEITKPDVVLFEPMAPILSELPPAAEPPPISRRPTPAAPTPLRPRSPQPPRETASGPAKAKKSGKTFAPPSSYKDAKEIVRPGKGTVVEVLVLWKERVLNTYHFHETGSIFIGGGKDADVVVPILSATSKFQLIKIAGAATVCVSPEMTGELIRDQESTTLSELARLNKMRNVGDIYEIELRQGEMMRLGLQNNLISLMIRYKAETPKPAVAPLLDFTASETTGVILAGVISAIFALYMSLYAPSALLDDEAQVEEPLRKAVVTFHPPKIDEAKVEEKQEPKKVKVVEVTDKTQSVKAEKKSADIKPKEQKASAVSVAKSGSPGKMSDVAPTQSTVKRKTPVSARPGGAIKTGAKEGANMKSDKPDPTKTGLLGVFSSKGTQAKLDKAYSGAGELQGMADAANGSAGSNEDRAGDVIGTKLKDTGAGGKGTSTIGIAGLGTKGRGTGTTGYGTGGLGSKGSVKVDVGGQDAAFSGSIDKDAIRRVILSHKNEIRFCYDKELQRSPGLAGKIRIGWNITETGAVIKAGVDENEMGSAAVANCIIGKLKTWTFPAAPPDVEAHVVYPFVFSSE